MTPAMLSGASGLDEAGRQRRLAFLDLGPQDEANLAEIRTSLQSHLDRIIDEFYAHLLRFEETRRALGDDAQIARLKTLQREHFLRMTEGRFDADYFESRLQVGDAHQRIDLYPEWYLGGYHLFVRLILDHLGERYGHDPDRLVALIGSLNKAIYLDMGLAIDAYIGGGFVHRSLAQEYRRMADVAKRTLDEKTAVEQMKADLTNMVVHDLKGPLGGILTVTQVALRKRGAVAAAHARHFEQIQRSARNLLRMIENLLEIDQMQEGRLELRVEPVDLAQLLTECADEFRPGAEQAGQRLDVVIGEDVPVIVTDRWLLRRVLNNLVTNAIRHSGASESITLAADLSAGFVRLHVRDKGRGIAAQDQATLFDKHPRRRRNQSREDTGLGLVFCKMATEVMGGKIRVESEPGVGATFTVTLPAIDPVEGWA